MIAYSGMTPDREVISMTERKQNVAWQALVSDIETHFRTYLYLPDPAAALVYALWAIGTHVYEHFYMFPRLAITASVPNAGKSRALKLLRPIVRFCEAIDTDPTPAALLRAIRDNRGKITILWDEAEATGGEKSFCREMMNSGAYKGDKVRRAIKDEATGASQTFFDTFCPAAFAMIGDPAKTMRSRSIVQQHDRASMTMPPFNPTIVDAIGMEFQYRIRHLLRDTSGFTPVDVPDLKNRNAEIWGTMFGIAYAIGLNEDTIERLKGFAARAAFDQTAPQRKTQIVEDEDKAVDDEYAETAYNDLRRVTKDDEHAILSVVAVRRMYALPDRAWSRYKGKGLDQTMLSALVSRFGLQTRDIKLGKKYKIERDPSVDKVGRGFYAKDIKSGSSK